ncbi:hypothetical protein [Frondihabitans sucicola]|uniref:hypothetical protein n=1 Tax=Frondihabitans sucicola TaxID=1268041 RepID=UPI0025737CF7|nr:hypothetical protein [Frondihabitans sucicola]
MSGLVKSNGDQDSAAALAAAYAGIEDYQSRLANDNTYQQYGNAASTFSNPPKTSANPNPYVSKFTSANGNDAFGLGASGTWAKIPGSTRAQYRYEVDNSAYYSTGIIRLRSTGEVGTTVRSEVAELKQNGFINYLYFTDYEVSDPAVSNLNCTPTYDWKTPHDSDCTELQFGPSDDLQGPVHSNDSLLICGSKFESTVETGYRVAGTAKPYNIPSSTCSAAQFTYQAGYAPVYSPPITMPATNLNMKQETRSDLTDTTVPRPGCLYTGPTTITFNDGGTMTVRSPWTVKTNWTADASGNPNGGIISGDCGTPGTGVGQLGSSTGQTINVPQNNLIYVQNVPHTTSNDPNYYSTSAKPTGLSCTGAAGGSTTGNGLGYPAAGEVAPTYASGTASYGCDTGDVFVKGTVQGKVTVAAENYVYVTDDLKYSTTDASNNLLGLVGNGAVWVYNPVDSNGALLDTSNTGITIDAAILSVLHTFQVQNYKAAGFKGNLTVLGSIAQKFRGAVGSTTSDRNGNVISRTGYTKVYLYDSRLRYTAPPKFLTPVSTSYGVSTLTETKPAFTANGGDR